MFPQIYSESGKLSKAIYAQLIIHQCSIQQTDKSDMLNRFGELCIYCICNFILQHTTQWRRHGFIKQYNFQTSKTGLLNYQMNFSKAC